MSKKSSTFVDDFLWWGRTDSNHRSDTQQIYSLSPLATRELPQIFICLFLIGAGRRTRTPDLLITNQLLYQLSYTGGSTEQAYYIMRNQKVKDYFRFLKNLKIMLDFFESRAIISVFGSSRRYSSVGRATDL